MYCFVLRGTEHLRCAMRASIERCRDPAMRPHFVRASVNRGAFSAGENRAVPPPTPVISTPHDSWEQMELSTTSSEPGACLLERLDQAALRSAPV